jgi:DNA polymerase III subunit chi
MRADFYIINEDNAQSRYPILCRIVEKAYQAGQCIYIHTTHEQEARLIDQLLWSYSDNSFIPHMLTGKYEAAIVPVQIGFAQEALGFNDILINLSFTIPSFYNQFQRIIELVWQNDEAKQICREHYRFFKNLGCELNTYDKRNVSR